MLCIVAIYCPPLNLTNHLVVSTNNTIFKTEVALTCDPGYKLANRTNSTAIVQCLDLIFNSTMLVWNDSMPRCVGG